MLKLVDSLKRKICECKVSARDQRQSENTASDTFVHPEHGQASLLDELPGSIWRCGVPIQPEDWECAIAAVIVQANEGP